MRFGLYCSLIISGVSGRPNCQRVAKEGEITLFINCNGGYTTTITHIETKGFFPSYSKFAHIYHAKLSKIASFFVGIFATYLVKDC